jgi:phosphopantothenoylcysteine synthetase/decarboxylase
MTAPTPRFLVTAGNTREMIDRVRDWGNVFTGNTGFAIARALAEVGEVDLLTSNREHLIQVEQGLGGRYLVRGSAFTSHAELKAALADLFSQSAFDAVFMTAAVADYRPAGVYQVADRRQNPDGTETWTVRDVRAAKVKSTYSAVAFLGEQTEKIVDLFRTQWNHRGLLFKFKLEVGVTAEELVRIAQASRIVSGADYLVANTLEMVEGPGAGAYLLSDRGVEFIPRNDLAPRLAQVVRERLV